MLRPFPNVLQAQSSVDNDKQKSLSSKRLDSNNDTRLPSVTGLPKFLQWKQNKLFYISRYKVCSNTLTRN